MGHLTNMSDHYKTCSAACVYAGVGEYHPSPVLKNKRGTTEAPIFRPNMSCSANELAGYPGTEEKKPALTYLAPSALGVFLAEDLVLEEMKGLLVGVFELFLVFTMIRVVSVFCQCSLLTVSHSCYCLWM